MILRVLVSGASGFVGSRLVGVLRARGAEVIAISRRPEAAERGLDGVKVIHWDDVTDTIAAGVDAVVHLAGETVQGRWNKAKAVAVKDSRVRTTRLLVDAVAAAPTPPSVFLSASGIGFYGEGGEDLLTEEAPAGDDFFADVCVEWEREALLAQQAGCRAAILRFGIILGDGGGALDAMLLPTKLGIAGPLGSGRQWWSWVHRDDAVNAICHALDSGEVSGPVNVVAPEAVRQADFQRALSSLVGRPSFMPAPAFALKMVLGTFAQEVLSSKKVVPKALQETGFTWSLPDLSDALREAISR